VESLASRVLAGLGWPWADAEPEPPAEPSAPWGYRVDGTPKGPGWFGPIPLPDGRVATEIGIGVELDGVETEIPSIVPTLSRDELDHLISGGWPTPEMIQKAVTFAVLRRLMGQSVWAREGESVALPWEPSK
jgi:hypothetical protein